MFNTKYAHFNPKNKAVHLLKQISQTNIINYGLPANMYTKTKAFDQNLFFSKSEAAIHYNSHYHRQRSFNQPTGSCNIVESPCIIDTRSCSEYSLTSHFLTLLCGENGVHMVNWLIFGPKQRLLVLVRTAIQF